MASSSKKAAPSSAPFVEVTALPKCGSGASASAPSTVLGKRKASELEQDTPAQIEVPQSRSFAPETSIRQILPSSLTVKHSVRLLLFLFIF